MADVNIFTQIIPLSWAAAVSPTALSVFLVMMSMSDNPKLAGLSFYVGALCILLVTLFLGILLGNTLTNTGHSDTSTKASIDLFLGAILILLGVRNAFSKENKNNGALSKYLQIDSNVSSFAKFRRYFSIGLLTFLINFSTAIFVLAAGREIGLAQAGILTDLVAIVVLVIITLIVVEIPLIFFLILPKTAEKITEPLNQWISAHSNYVMAVISETYDPNLEGNTASAAMDVQAPTVPVNAQTIGMQPTGAPFVGLIVALLILFVGIILPRRK
jgi:threonine/homoserine/homoserine lactone efflux protein